MKGKKVNPQKAKAFMHKNIRRFHDLLTDLVRFPFDEGTKLIFDEGYGASFETIALVFDRDLRPIVTKKEWLDRFESGESIRILAALIDDAPGIIAIRAHDLPELLSFEDVRDEVDLRHISACIKKFMKKRLRVGPPFYGLTSGRSASKYDFMIYREPNLTDEALTSRIKKFWEHPPSIMASRERISLHFSNFIGFSISETDEELIEAWAGVNTANGERSLISRHSMRLNDPAKKLKYLIHARLAEKTAISIYSALSKEPVEDVSILQLGGQDTRWKDFDIRADKPIDVKNTTIYRNNTRQNFVRKFKRANGDDVVIAGIATRQDRVRVIQTYLGEVSQDDLRMTEAAIQRAFSNVEPVQIRLDDRHLPAWAFEYPFGQLNYTELLDAYKLLADKPKSILAAAIAAGKVRDIPTYEKLPPSQRRIVDLFSEVVNNSSYSKKTIVLFAVAGVVSETLTGGDPQGFVNFFRQLLEMEELGQTEPPRVPSIDLIFGKSRAVQSDKTGVGARRCPPFRESNIGGLADPLDSVPKMLSLLSQAAVGVASSGLDFVAFHAPNPHILLGCPKDGPVITVYAYCGGRSKIGISCDTFPMVIGRNDTCRSCGKLICHECGFCSTGCARQPCSTGPAGHR